MEYKKKIEDCLKENKFKKKWLTDKSGYWYEFKFKAGMFKFEMLADNNRLYFDIMDVEGIYNTVMITKLTEKNIVKLVRLAVKYSK